MKNSAKPVLAYSIVCLILFGGMILSNVVIKLNCDKFQRDIIEQQDVLETKRDSQIKLQAELQNWCSEEKLADAAKALNLEKMTEKTIVIEVDKNKIDQVNKVISQDNE